MERFFTARELVITSSRVQWNAAIEASCRTLFVRNTIVTSLMRFAVDAVLKDNVLPRTVEDKEC